MAQRGGVRVRFHTSSLPTYDGAFAAAHDGVRTGGHARNLDYVSGHLVTGNGVDPAFEALCLDPQTSGGLLAAVHPSVAEHLEGFLAPAHAGEPVVNQHHPRRVASAGVHARNSVSRCAPDRV